MGNTVRQQIEKILEQAELEDKDRVFLTQALAIDIPREDGPWLKSIFRLAAVFLKLACGTKENANRALPWLLFSMGMAYEHNKSERRE